MVAKHRKRPKRVGKVALPAYLRSPRITSKARNYATVAEVMKLIHKDGGAQLRHEIPARHREILQFIHPSHTKNGKLVSGVTITHIPDHLVGHLIAGKKRALAAVRAGRSVATSRTIRRVQKSNI